MTDNRILSTLADSTIAGKNKIINGDFNINQRSFTSITASGSGQYGFDRWKIEMGGDGSVTYTPQTFTLGTAPVTGYEAANFARVVVASQTSAGAYSIFAQGIEDVRTFANQTVTVSFWAKASSGTPKVAAEFVQVFGTGGSPSSNVNIYAGQATLTTSWARYTITANVPSIAGKTIGTTTNTSQIGLLLWTSAGSTYNGRTGSIGIQNNTIDIWGVQVEAGSVATAFQTATGTIQGELAACQRYLPAVTPEDGEFASGFCYSTTKALFPIVFPVTPRIGPTGITVNTVGEFAVRSANATQLTATALAFSTGTAQGACIEATVASGLVAGNGTNLFNYGNGRILFTGCEL